jgi:FKBP-type peptidyl-prolyl cis-trans isomerase
MQSVINAQPIKGYEMKCVGYSSIVLSIIFAAGAVCLPAVAQDPAPEGAKIVLENEVDKISYSIGQQFGTTILQNELEVNVKAVLKGMEDMLMKQEPALTEEEMQAAMMALQTKMSAKKEAMMAEMKVEAEENLKKAEAFLEENKTKEGVVVLPSGLQYQVVEKGEGDPPAATSKVKVHYRGTLLDGTQFDSSYDRGEPAEFGVNQVISGWQEALQLMSPGAKLKLFIPPSLGYGENGNARIPGNSVLIFDVELMEILQ